MTESTEFSDQKQVFGHPQGLFYLFFGQFHGSYFFYRTNPFCYKYYIAKTRGTTLSNLKNFSLSKNSRNYGTGHIYQ